MIEIANANDFVLICMPEGQRYLRYSDLIADVTECIYKDRLVPGSLVSDILARISSAPHHQQTVGTALQMLCAELGCSAVLTTHEGNILNLATWLSGMEDPVRDGIERCLPLSAEQTCVPCPFLADAEMSCISIHSDLAQPLRLALIKVGAPLGASLVEQAADIVRICINIWGNQHGAVAIHELLRAILQAEPLKMRRLAEIFHVDVASVHELWMLCGADMGVVEQRIEQDLALARQCADTVVGAIYEGQPVMCLSTPHSLRETESTIREILSCALETSPDAVVVRCSGLSNTTSFRRAYLLTLDNLEDARRIFPHKKCSCKGNWSWRLPAANALTKEKPLLCGAPCRWQLYRLTGNTTICWIRPVSSFWTATAALHGLRRCCFSIRTPSSTGFRELRTSWATGWEKCRRPSSFTAAPRFTGFFMRFVDIYNK